MDRYWKKGIVLLALGAILGAVPALKVLAGDEGMPAPKMPAEFDQVKALVGTWKGTASHMGGDKPDKPMEVTNTFELTSNGSAILEKICAGTPHEMVSVYCVEGGKLMMTHYCSVGNHPIMSLESNKDNEMDFAVKGHAGLGSAKEMHMHGMNIVWKDPDHIVEQWTLYDKGKVMTHSDFELTRVKE